MNLLGPLCHYLRRAFWGVVRRLIPYLPIGVLRILGSWIASARPIGAFPGWHFGIEEQQATSRLVARLRLWTHFKSCDIEKPVRVRWVEGLQLDLVLGNDLSRCMYVGGSFEPNEFFFLRESLSKGNVFIDVGANEGFYTVYAARCVGPNGKVVAIEPSPREYTRLQRNVAINGLSNVILVKSALGARQGSAVLHVADSEHNGQNTLGDFGHAGITAVEHLEVEITTLDSLLENLALARVDVIKMDVEGSELEVLKGAVVTLQRHRPTLLIEVFDAALRSQGASGEQLLSLLNDYDYQFHAFSEATGLLQPLKRLDSASQNIVATHRSQIVSYPASADA